MFQLLVSLIWLGPGLDGHHDTRFRVVFDWSRAEKQRHHMCVFVCVCVCVMCAFLRQRGKGQSSPYRLYLELPLCPPKR